MHSSTWRACACLLLCCGCSGGPMTLPMPDLHKVTGQIVNKQKKPVANCTILFQAIGGGQSASGKTQSNGEFQLAVDPSHPGAGAGNYRVTIMGPPGFVVGGGYSDPEDSPLKIELKEQDQTLEPIVIEMSPQNGKGIVAQAPPGAVPPGAVPPGQQYPGAPPQAPVANPYAAAPQYAQPTPYAAPPAAYPQPSQQAPTQNAPALNSAGQPRYTNNED